MSPRPSPHAAGEIRSSVSATGVGRADKGSVDDQAYGRRNPNAQGVARRMLSDAANEWRRAHPKSVRLTEVQVHDAPDPLPEGSPIPMTDIL